MSRDVEKFFERAGPQFSKSGRKLVEFICANAESAAYMTAARLGEAAGISESTVVRFAVFMGYEGYPEFQKAFQEYLKAKLTSVQRIEVSTRRIKTENLLENIFGADIDNIKRTAENIDREAFDAVAREIVSARRIYILGVRASRVLSDFMGYYFGLMFDNVRLVSPTWDACDKFTGLSSEDVVIVISFPRYSKGAVETAKFTHNRGAKNIVITDGPSSPLVPYASRVLYAAGDMVSFADSLVAPMSLVNALITAVSILKKNELSVALCELERIWQEYGVYDGGE